MRHLGLGGDRADAFFVDDAPDCGDDAAVGAWGGDYGLEFVGFWWWCSGAGKGGLLAETRGGKGGDLCATEDGFEGEADEEFKARGEEGEEAPGARVEDGVDGEVSFEEERGGGADEVGQAGVEDCDGDEVGRGGVVVGWEEADSSEEGAGAVGGRGEDEKGAGGVDGGEEDGG